MLVRSEKGYQVLSLPDYVELIVGDVGEEDCRKFADAMRAETPYDDLRLSPVIKAEALREPAKLIEVINQARTDPYEPVRKVAPGLLALVAAGQYYERGQFSNAVLICRQALLLNPKDGWIYNMLAWIKATCSDTSLRDGKEAVSAATKACELSAWTQRDWIDTLAAAYAETGDFNRAVQFQEQALRTGIPSRSDRKEMRERLALYKQSQPCRGKP